MNKQICIRCFNKVHPKDGEGWTILEEEWWRTGKVTCPSAILREAKEVDEFGEVNTRFHSIRHKPPKYCPYELEHLVNAKR